MYRDKNELADFIQGGRNDFLEHRSFCPPIEPEKHPDYGVDLSISEVDEMRENREAYIKGFEGELSRQSELFISGFKDRLNNEYKPPMKPEDHPDFRSGLTTSEKEEMRRDYDEYIKGYSHMK